MEAQRSGHGGEKLQRELLAAVWAIVLLFFAFAAGVWAGEQAQPADKPQAPVTAVGGEKMLSAGEPEDGGAVRTDPCAITPDPNIEDTYLREDIPLTYAEQAALYGACREFAVEYPVMLALIERETGFCNSTGDGGDSVGYCQIQRRWWGELMEEIGAEDLNEAEDNFRTGCAIVARLTRQHGNLADALTAYNRGTPGDSAYSRAILAAAERWA